MNGKIEGVVLLLAMGAAMAGAQMSQAPMQGPNPHGGAPDMGRMQQQATVDSMAAAKLPLKITFGPKSAEWTLDKLAALPHRTVTVYNEHTKATESYSGVALIDLLTPLGFPDKPKGKDLRNYLVALGSDGYEVVYAAGEVTPDVHDATVMVADSEGGKPIAADGPLKLVATGEKRPARWVRNLVAVKVLIAP